MFQMVQVRARFVRQSDGRPLSGPHYRARLYDKDILFDDSLGEAELDEEGRVQFLFELADAASLDSFFESRPDLYVVLYEKDQVIFRSPVVRDVEFRKREGTGEDCLLIPDLGTFAV